MLEVIGKLIKDKVYNVNGGKGYVNLLSVIKLFVCYYSYLMFFLC